MNTNLPSHVGINARDAAPNSNASSSTHGTEPKNSQGDSRPDCETLAGSGRQADADQLSHQDNSSVRQQPATDSNEGIARQPNVAPLEMPSGTAGAQSETEGPSQADYCKNGLLDLYRIQAIAALRNFRKHHGQPLAAVFLRDALIADAALEGYEEKLREKL